MKTFGLIAVVAVAIVLAAAPPSRAVGHSIAGGHSAGHFEGHRGFEGRRDFDRDHHFRGAIIEPFFFGAPFYGDYPPAYVPPPRAYWYFCPSYGAYYPNVGSCPEAWVPVPAS